jgi:hypothetical protein
LAIGGAHPPVAGSSRFTPARTLMISMPPNRPLSTLTPVPEAAMSRSRRLAASTSFRSTPIAAVEIVAPHPLGDPRQHRVDKGIVVGAALAFRNHIERDLDRALQFFHGSMEVQCLFIEPSGKIDNRAFLQPSQFGGSNKPRAQRRDQLVGRGTADADALDSQIPFHMNVLEFNSGVGHQVLSRLNVRSASTSCVLRDALLAERSSA